jgi:hypothetical protein
MFEIHIAFIPHFDAFGMVSIRATPSEDEGRLVHHFTFSLNPSTHPNVFEIDIAAGGNVGVFRLQTALMSHLDLVVIRIACGTGCGVFNSNIESHHFPEWI